jgi:hypothetical protein
MMQRSETTGNLEPLGWLRLVSNIRARLTVARTMLRLAYTYKASLADPLRSARAVNDARAALEAVRKSLSTADLATRERASIQHELCDLEAELEIRQAGGEEEDGRQNPN